MYSLKCTINIDTLKGDVIIWLHKTCTTTTREKLKTIFYPKNHEKDTNKEDTKSKPIISYSKITLPKFNGCIFSTWN